MFETFQHYAQQGHTAMTDNRRQHERKLVNPEDAFGLIVQDLEKIPVLIVDESVGGVGVIAVNADRLEIGSVVQFESRTRHGETRVGLLKYVNISDNDVYQVGLEWTD